MIGAVVGFVAGHYLKGSEHGPAIDVVAGAVGGCVAVVLTRIVGLAAAANYLMSAIVAIVGAVVALYGARRLMKPKPVPVRPLRRRR